MEETLCRVEATSRWKSRFSMANKMCDDTVVYSKFTPHSRLPNKNRKEHLFHDQIHCENTDFRYCKYYVNDMCYIRLAMLV